MGEDVEFDYDYLMHKALRNLMREVLGMVAELGDTPGEHHFYIEFLTQAPGVVLPDNLKKDYPERMTIVLQHQFENLSVDDKGFSVTLWFKNKEARLQIPFDSVVSFADPSAQFGLRFEAADADQDDAGSSPPSNQSIENENAPADSQKEADSSEKKENGADIVSLDSFRKK